MKLAHVIIAILIIWSNASIAQSHFELTGTVLSSKSYEPIPFAHIQIAGTNAGTVSNANGQFNLHVPTKSTMLYITSIGFKATKVSVDGSRDKSIRIVLEEDLVALSEVVFVGVDEARLLVEKAINQIPVNYPQEDIRLTGFVREILSKDSLQAEPYYVSEAELALAKQPYDKSTQNGVVKLIKGRRATTSAYDSLRLSIYAGAHLPHRFDVAMTRQGPLELKSHNKYFFEITDTLRFEGLNLYEVSFDLEKKRSFEGKLYIQEESFAIVKATYRYGLNAAPGMMDFLSPRDRLYLHFEVEYFPTSYGWMLGHINYKTAFSHRGDKQIYLNSIYSTHDASPQIEPIPYAEQVQFRDFLLEEVANFNPDYWQGSTVMLADETTKRLFEGKNGTIETEGKQKKFIAFLRRWSIQYQIIHSGGKIGSDQFAYQPDANSECVECQFSAGLYDETFSLFGASTTYRFHISKQLFVDITFCGGFKRHTYQENRYGVGYRINIASNSARPLYIAPTLGLSTATHHRLASTALLTESRQIENIQYKPGRIDIYATQKSIHWTPGLMLEWERNRKLSIIATVSFQTEISAKEGITFTQRRNSLNNQQLFVNQYSKNLNSSGHLNFKRGVTTSMGIRWGL